MGAVCVVWVSCGSSGCGVGIVSHILHSTEAPRCLAFEYIPSESACLPLTNGSAAARWFINAAMCNAVNPFVPSLSIGLAPACSRAAQCGHSAVDGAVRWTVAVQWRAAVSTLTSRSPPAKPLYKAHHCTAPPDREAQTHSPLLSLAHLRHTVQAPGPHCPSTLPDEAV
jgi:hypothetical protein